MRTVGSLAVTLMLAALPLYACAGATETETDAGTPPSVDAGAPVQTAAEVHANVRDGFIAEAQWMRMYAVAALDGTPDSDAAFASLSSTEAQIVQHIAPFAGDAGAAELGGLLHARTQAFADLITSMKAATASVANDPQAALDANAQAIAQFFVTLCPGAFPPSAGAFLETANRDMVAGLEARAAGDDQTAVADFDKAQASSSQFADAVGTALSTTFAVELARGTTSRAQDALVLHLHLLLGDQSFWTRAYMIDQLSNVTAQPELDRSVQATTNVGDVYASYFGPDIGGQVQFFIHTDTTDAVAFLLAVQSGDQGTVDAIGAKWNADADQFAQFLIANTTINQQELQRVLRTNVDRERAMIQARVDKQWQADAVDYQMVLANRSTLANLLATPIVARLPSSAPH